MIVMLKTVGYMISIVSVILLGIVAWRMAAEDEWLRFCLIGGIALSILGMLLRWISHLKDQREKEKLAAQARAGSAPGF